jgi:endonuclease III
MSADRETRKSAGALYRMLTKTYPEVDCELDFQNPLQLVIATLLSAQCTDKRVNSVTPRLFKKYKNVRAYAKAPVEEIEEIILPLGFHHTKARHIKGLSTKIVEEFNGEVPATLEELITLPGVGQKDCQRCVGSCLRYSRNYS